MATVAGYDIRDIVKEPAWQELRSSLVGTWKDMPAQNVLKLRAYLGKDPDQFQLVRVHNYLTGTGFRLGTIAHPDITALLQEVRELRKRGAGVAL